MTASPAVYRMGMKSATLRSRFATEREHFSLSSLSPNLVRYVALLEGALGSCAITVIKSLANALLSLAVRE